MATTDGYEQRLRARLRVESAPTIVTRALRNADMAVTEIKCDNPFAENERPDPAGKCLPRRFAAR
jgi:hypothetical protein